jgi:protein-S-isoprenylcysteine O-methyltransferase Ste14
MTSAVGKRYWLALRAVLAVVLLPGTVAVYLPYLLLSDRGPLQLPQFSVAAMLSALLLLAGAAVLLRCVWDFFASGQGTLAPVDPPTHLVVQGLYRYTRNPMYNGVLAMLLGQAGLFQSLTLLAYAGVVAGCFHVFVLLYEEPALAAQFGQAYQDYRQAVPRWGFCRRPFSAPQQR